MIEQLDYLNGVNSDGDVVPLDDIYIVPTENLNYGLGYAERRLDPSRVQISPESLAIASLTQVREEKLLSAKSNHPAMSGETIDKADAFVLGEVAQSALDVYMNKTDIMRRNGAQDERATRGPHYKDLMIELAKGRGISGKEVHAILALVSPSAIEQMPAPPIALDDDSHRGRPTYRDARSAAANDY